MSWLTAILAAIAAIPKIIDAIQSIITSWESFRDDQTKANDTKEIQNEIDNVAGPGGRPTAN